MFLSYLPAHNTPGVEIKFANATGSVLYGEQDRLECGSSLSVVIREAGPWGAADDGAANGRRSLLSERYD